MSEDKLLPDSTIDCFSHVFCSRLAGQRPKKVQVGDRSGNKKQIEEEMLLRLCPLASFVSSGKSHSLPRSVTMPSTASPEGVTSVALLRSIFEASKTSREPAFAFVICIKRMASLNKLVPPCRQHARQSERSKLYLFDGIQNQIIFGAP